MRVGAWMHGGGLALAMMLVPPLSSCVGCGGLQAPGEDGHTGVNNTGGGDGGGTVGNDGGNNVGDSGIPGFCGDAQTDTGEECDDGNEDDFDTCHNDCTRACGDGVVATFERCDVSIAAGQTGACPTACNDAPSCNTGTLEGADCLVECVYSPIAVCLDGDGCCGFGCNASDDRECTATCGNGIPEPGETCDPPGTCLTTCDDSNPCTTDVMGGSVAMCNVTCTHTDITTCSLTASDQCCATGCSPTTDIDCMGTCGNGIPEGNESCDPPSSCPATCDDNDPCTIDGQTGAASTCDLRCTHEEIVQTVAGDMCCPDGANANTDPECIPDCGNGVPEMGETCDGNCPTCDDGNPCTVDITSGTPATCDVVCSTMEFPTCQDGDTCCPSTCNSGNDDDCSAGCDNGALDPGETCDPISSCPTMCVTTDPCSPMVLQGSAANCNAECVAAPITTCSGTTSDLCCIMGMCNNNTDVDCAPSCGNGVQEGTELCDGASCPSSCSDGVACTQDVLTGSTAMCDAQCTFPAITTCSMTSDGCCPSACVPSTDSDCVGALNPASMVTATSSCLVAGSGARAAIVATLTDTNGLPFPGATVTMSTSAGTMSAVTANGNVYVGTLTAGGSAATATITITANGTQLTTQPTVTFAAPFTSLLGGGGGCNIEGNLRVRVVDAAGAPISGAYVMAGNQENLAAYAATYGAAPTLANTAQTNAAGFATFTDFGATLRGATTITAGQAGYRYVTFATIDAADVVIPLDVVTSTVMTGQYTGDFTGYLPDPPARGDPIEFGLALPDTTLEKLANLNLTNLLGRNECYAAGGFAGNLEIPSNVFIPAQCAALAFGFCVQNLPRHAYTSPPIPYGSHKIVGIYGSAPLNAVTGPGGIAAGLPQVTIARAGLIDRAVAAPGPTTSNIDTSLAVSTDVTCNLSNLPVLSDVFCATAVDFDSGASGTLSPGEGRLGLTGFRVSTLTGSTTTANITQVPRAPRTSGVFAGGEYLGIIVARYLDDTRSGIPVGTEDGTTAVMSRNNPYGNSGGTITVNNFFPIRTITQSGRTVTQSALPASPNPAAHFVIHTFSHVLINNYTACTTNDSTQTTEQIVWRAYTPGNANAFTLVGSSRVDLQACKLEYSIVSPK